MDHSIRSDTPGAHVKSPGVGKKRFQNSSPEDWWNPCWKWKRVRFNSKKVQKHERIFTQMASLLKFCFVFVSFQLFFGDKLFKT